MAAFGLVAVTDSAALLLVPPEAAKDHGEDRERDGSQAERDRGHGDGEQDAGDEAEDTVEWQGGGSDVWG